MINMVCRRIIFQALFITFTTVFKILSTLDFYNKPLKSETSRNKSAVSRKPASNTESSKKCSLPCNENVTDEFEFPLTIMAKNIA